MACCPAQLVHEAIMQVQGSERDAKRTTRSHDDEPHVSYTSMPDENVDAVGNCLSHSCKRTI